MPRELTYRDALNEALHEEMARDASVFVIGEDVGRHGGPMQVCKGLWSKYGDWRVRDTPISEAGFVGLGVGAALTGLRPVVEIMYIDFGALAMDQIVNQAAKARYMFGGKASVPMVIRTQGGGGRGNAAQHSQSLEMWFVHTPGLVVVQPSMPADAKGLLKSAIRDQNPIMFIEHKLLYNTIGLVPDGEYTIPLGVADVKRPGKDVTIVAHSRMVLFALNAAEKLAAEGVDAEVIDPRTLKPLDLDTIVLSVKKTHRLVVVSEGVRTGGFASEVAARVQETAFDWLDGPVIRVASEDVPMPYNERLELEAIPTEADIVRDGPRDDVAMRLLDRSAIITGGARGIGRAIGKAFAAEGARVALTDIDASALEAAGQELQALAVVTDVADEGSVQAMVEQVMKSYGRIDILVNNAGICPLTPFESIRRADWDRVLAINLTGAFLCSQAVVPSMTRAGYGRIINISSVAGKMGGVTVGAHYAASKAGLLGLTWSLARLYAPFGITANAIAPVTIETELTRDWSKQALEQIRQSIPLGRLARANDVAAAAVFLASEEAGFITGEVIDVNGGFLMD